MEIGQFGIEIITKVSAIDDNKTMVIYIKDKGIRLFNPTTLSKKLISLDVGEDD
jgi:hypothetical protein